MRGLGAQYARSVGSGSRVLPLAPATIAQIAAGHEVRIVLPEPVTLEVRARLPDGSPAVGARLRLYDRRRDTHEWTTLRDGVADADGRVVFADLRPDRSVSVYEPGFRSGEQIEVTATEDEKAKGPARTIRTVAGTVDTSVPYRVADIETKRSSTRPSAPFITSTLQQAASSRLGFAARRTMRTAQNLYEGIDLPGEGRELPLVGFDGNATSTLKLADHFEIQLTPTVLLVDTQGRVLAKPLVGIWSLDFFGGILDARIDNAVAALPRPAPLLADERRGR